jgi:hypothetical protein
LSRVGVPMLSSIRSPSPHQSTVDQRYGTSPSNPVERVEWLERKCRAMRAQGRTGHWSYDLGLHNTLLMVLKAERAALHAEKCLPASPDRQHARAA